MTSSRTAVAAAVIALSGAGAEAASIKVDADCRTVRIRADGSRVVTPARSPGRSDGSNTVAARSSSQGGGAVSMSSSSTSGSGRSVSTSTVNGITVTVTRDETGCTAVIDERANKRSSR